MSIQMRRVFGRRSLNNLQGVDSRLVAVARRALEIGPHDFTVTEGLRTVERQRELVKAGKSRTMNSYHLRGKAIDLYPCLAGKVVIECDWQVYVEIADAFKAAAKELGHTITWGGDWPKFRDGPHYQIEN